MVIRFDIPDLEFRLRQPTAEVLNAMGEAAAMQLSDRIRNLHLTADLSALDPNSEGWEEAKLTNTTPEPAISAHPLVYTGQSTNALEPYRITVGNNEIAIQYTGPARETVAEVWAHSEELGNNWRDAYSLGELENAAAMKPLIKFWRDENPVDIIES